MRRAETYDGFAVTVTRGTGLFALRDRIKRWLEWGLCEPLTLGRRDEWFTNAAYSCEEPVRFRWYVADRPTPSTFDASKMSIGGVPEHPTGLTILFRCKKCRSCQAFRAWDWARRAEREFDRSAATWFGTLTLSPASHALVDQWVADGKLWPDRSRLSDDEFNSRLFAARARIVAGRVKTWLRLVRYWADMRLNKRGLVRYLLVAERHNSCETAAEMRGRPHFHLLLHETVPSAAFEGDLAKCWQGQDNGELVRRKYKNSAGEWVPGVFAADGAIARKAWVLGHSKFQHCADAKAAYYLCKYMHKSGEFRVRSSLRYGATDFVAP